MKAKHYQSESCKSHHSQVSNMEHSLLINSLGGMEGSTQNVRDLACLQFLGEADAGDNVHSAE